MEKKSAINKSLIQAIKKSGIFPILLLGVFLRLFYIGNIPGNNALYVDEMFSGYEAWSILKYGFDFAGYHFPVYLPAWGWGMNAMEAYCQIPFIALFGLNSFTVRLPQALLGCITLYVFYYICKNIKTEEFARFATFILAVMPWHIMQSRWAIECNFYCGFMAISIALLIKASKDNRFLPLAFFFIGAALYTYALPWTIMPVFVLGSTIYLFRSGALKFNKYLIFSFIVLIILAMPLLLFVAINMGFISEIKTPIISIPKMHHFRSGELSLSPRALMTHLIDAFKMFVKQDDGTVLGTTALFGLYYKISGIFILIGLAECLVSFFTKQKRRGNEFYIILLFVCALIVASSTELYFYRINIIQIPMTFFLANGLWYLADILQHRTKEVTMAVYGILCFFFFIYYITEYDDSVAKFLNDGNKSSIEFVNNQKASGEISQDAEIHIASGMSFISVLFYNRYPTDRYVQEVVYADTAITGPKELAQSFGSYRFYYDQPLPDEPASGDVFICSTTDTATIDYLEAHNMDINYFSYNIVAVAP